MQTLREDGRTEMSRDTLHYITLHYITLHYTHTHTHMSPKLFTEFLYDLKTYRDEKAGINFDDSVLNYMLYADDLVLCSETREGLQKLLNGLFDFCKDWHLILNLAKTNVLIYGDKKHARFTFNGEEVSVAKEYKYLGTVFSTNCRDPLKKTKEHLVSKSQNALFALKSHVKNSVGQLTPYLSMKMFDVQISPILGYASEIWFNGKEAREFEKVHLTYLKTMLKVKKSSCNNAVYAECGRFPLLLKQKVQVLKYWERILHLDQSHLVKKAYNSILSIHKQGQINWCNSVKDVLVEMDMLGAWDDQCITLQDINIINETLHTKFMNNTLEDIANSTKFPKLRTYKLFKKDFRLENYLVEIENTKHALALARFRISSHNLRIETGRYDQRKTKPEERFCIYCRSQAVEDEQHFLLQCPLYNSERRLLLETANAMIPLFHLLPENEKFSAVMQSKTPKVMTALGNYILHASRKEALVQLQIKTLHRDLKVLAKIYSLYYGAKIYLFIRLLRN